MFVSQHALQTDSKSDPEASLQPSLQNEDLPCRFQKSGRFVVQLLYNHPTFLSLVLIFSSLVTSLNLICTLCDLSTSERVESRASYSLGSQLPRLGECHAGGLPLAPTKPHQTPVLRTSRDSEPSLVSWRPERLTWTRPESTYPPRACPSAPWSCGYLR